MSAEPAGAAAISPLDLDELRAKLAAASGGPLEPLGLRRVVEGPGALDQLGDLLAAACAAASGPVVVLAAATPMSVRGAGLRETIRPVTGSRSGSSWVVLGPASGSLHADEQTVAAARAAAAGAGCVVTVGSGTLTDIGKAAAGPGSALITVQTATSVNGYADPFSVLLRDGVKRTTPTRWPDALVIDPDVLCGGPAGLNQAGAGDLAAMFTATADWYLAAVLRAGGPPYHGEVAALVRPHGARMLALAGELAGGPGPACRQRPGRRAAGWPSWPGC